MVEPAPPSAFRRDRFEHDLEFPCECYEPAFGRVPRPRQAPSESGWGRLLQHDGFGTRAENGLHGIRPWRTVYQPHDRIRPSDRLERHTLAEGPGELHDRRKA